MTENRFGPYGAFVQEKLEGARESPMSLFEVLELHRLTDYVKHRDNFIEIINIYEDKLLCGASACFAIASALWTIVCLRGNSYQPIFERVWGKFIRFIDFDFSKSLFYFDLDAAFNGIRLGIEAKLDVSIIIEKVAQYLKAVVSPLGNGIDRRDIWSVVTNHSDILTSIYESEQYESVSLEIDEAIEELKVILGK